MRIVLATALCASLCGCISHFGDTYYRSQGVEHTASYVAPMSISSDPTILASGVADMVAVRLIPDTTVLALAPVHHGDHPDLMTPLVSDDLRKRGFALIADVATPAEGHRLSYLVSDFDGGDLIRVDLDDGNVEISRFFVRNTAGYLQPGGPMAMRITEAAR